MNGFDHRVSLNIHRPRTSVFVYGTILFLVLCILGELIARTSFVQAQIPYQAYGINHTQLELQLNTLDHFVREHGVPDCFIFGSSQAFREVDTEAFVQAYQSASGETVICYNFGITGSQIWTTSILSKILIPKYHPRLVIIGTSFLDYTEGRESDINERFVSNDWLKYQTGQFTLGGWLTENSYAWRALTLLSYAAPSGMRYSGVLRESHKWDGEIADSGFALSDKPFDSSVPVESGFIKNLLLEFGDFGVSERNLFALEETITFSQQAGAQVLLAEMTYHPALLELKNQKGNPRVDKEQILAFINKINTRLNSIAADHKITFLEFDPTLSIPDTGWFDLYHLNRVGAEVFSRWLGEQAAQALGPLPPARTTNEGN